ncbi:MAG: hypothetical protein HYY57_03675 [Candidatus Omnitrophica bacterium]|nr:hypothetical protein [Candidatus Omnitrophota bacterium]
MKCFKGVWAIAGILLVGFTTVSLSQEAFADPQLVNGYLNLDDVDVPPAGSVPPGGIYAITATFTNTSSSFLKQPFFKVAQLKYNSNPLTPAPECTSCDRNGTGVDCEQDVDIQNGFVIAPGESFTITFDILLPRIANFTFLTNAYSEVNALPQDIWVP